MSVLNEDWSPLSNEQLAEANSTNELTVKLDGRNYNVIDGDTLKDTETGERVRVDGLTAPEIEHPDYAEGQGIKNKAEVGGYQARYNLYKVINDGNFNTLGNLRKQEYGAGAGNRLVGDITNDKGQDAASVLYELGAIAPSEQTNTKGLNAIRDGKLERSLFGTSKTDEQFAGIREGTPRNPLVFKGLALNENWYDPDYYSGVQFRDNNVELYDNDKGRGGFTKNPISTAWNAGWINTKADIGAALNALGTATNSEWLEDVGDDVRIKAGNKLAEVPALKVQQLADIKGKNYLDTASNLIEWIGVNTTMSLPYMAAIAAPSLLAAPLTGGASLAAGIGARTVAGLPAMALHTGNVWNQVDVENRTQASAGKSMVAGLGMTMIDLFALGKIMKPSQLLTAEGKDIAINHIAKTQTKGDVAQATQLFNSTARNETAKFLEHMGTDAAKHVNKVNGAKDALAAFVSAAPVEAVTEVGQELTGYLTAANINGEEPDVDEMINIALNSAAAGGVVGGSFGAAGSAFSANKAYNIRKGLEEFDPSTLNGWQQVYWELEQNGNPDGTIADQINTTKAAKRASLSDDEGRFYAMGEQSKQDPYWKDKLLEDGKLQVNPISLIDTALHYSGRLVKAPLLNWISPEDLRQNPFIRTVVGRTMNNRGIGSPGKHMEARRNAVQGVLTKTFDDRKVMAEFDIGTSNKKAAAFSRKFIEFGRRGLFDKMKAARAKGTLVPTADIEAAGFTTEDANKFYDAARRADNMMKAGKQTKRNALVLEFGSDSDIVTNFDKSNVDGYWWKHQSADVSKIINDEVGYTKFIQRKMNEALADKSLTAEQKREIQSTSAAERVARYISDPAASTDALSLVEGVSWASNPKARLLNISEDPEFSKWSSDNVFDSYNSYNEQVAKEVSHLEYFGDGGSDLDFLYGQALNYEINQRGLPREEAEKKIGRLALAHRNVIDASSNNFNRIENRRLAGLQKNFLSYTSFTYLPLAALSSFPEFAAVLLDLANAGEFKKAVTTSIREIQKGLKKSLVDVDNGKIKRGVLLGGTTQPGQAQDVLESLGIDESPSALYQKLGLADAMPHGQLMRKVMDRFFTFTGIRGVTQVQRRINASFAADFALNRLTELSNIPEGAKYTQNQGEAFAELSALGMNVPKMIAILRDGNSRGLSRETLDLTLLPEQRNQLESSTQDEVVREMETFIANFVNERIQNPGASNRPLIFQDPHYAMLFVFNGFLSTFTANVVPKLWNDKVGKAIRHKNPTLAYNAFVMIATMVALGALGQWMRDYLKYGGSSPHLEGGQFVHRAFLASGVLGQFEKLSNIAYPLYDTRGEGAGDRLRGEAFGPTGRFAETVGKGFDQLTNEESPDGAALNTFLKLAPGTSLFPWARDAVNPFK